MSIFWVLSLKVINSGVDNRKQVGAVKMQIHIV